jgi:hypothetical protein
MNGQDERAGPDRQAGHTLHAQWQGGGSQPGELPATGPQPFPPYAQQYPPPQVEYPRASPGVNGLAIASLVLGIIWIYWIGSIIAVIFGHVALGQIKRTGQSGKGLAIAGLTLGWVGVGIGLFVVMALLVSALSGL